MLIKKNRMGWKCNRGKFSVSHFNLCIWRPAGFSFSFGNICLRNQPVSESLFVFFPSLLSKRVIFFCYCFGIWEKLSNQSAEATACSRFSVSWHKPLVQWSSLLGIVWLSCDHTKMKVEDGQGALGEAFPPGLGK